MSEELQVGVIGVGHIGKNHARIYSELPGCRLAAIFDADEKAALKMQKAYGGVVVGSLEEFAEKIDAATIATPTQFHHEMAMPLLKQGKALLIEKPITTSTDQARELVETARQHNAPLQVGHIERFNPALDALEELLTQPRFIESHRLSPFPNRSTDIDVVLDLMIHDLEIILHLVSSRVASFDAVGVPVLSGQADIANVRLKFENACVANITASRVSPEKMRKIRIFQSDTYISLDYQDQAGQIFRKDGDKISRDKVKVMKDEPLKRELASFVEVAKAGGEPRVTGAQGAAALELAVRISEDIRQTNDQMPEL
jgi:predicted dehydrogenase